MPWLKKGNRYLAGEEHGVLSCKWRSSNFLLEEECYSGVAKIAEKVCGDVELVTGIRPVTRRISKTYLDEQKESEYVVLVGTVGKFRIREIEWTGSIG